MKGVRHLVVEQFEIAHFSVSLLLASVRLRQADFLTVHQDL